MRIRNVSGIDREVPLLGRIVEADAVVDVPEHLVGLFLAAPSTWEEAEPPPPPKSSNKKREE